jgi:uncharacterized protein (TIGR01777 family)
MSADSAGNQRSTSPQDLLALFALIAGALHIHCEGIPSPSSCFTIHWELILVNVVMSGSSGLIGRKLTTDLKASGANVIRLVRDPTPNRDPDSREWDPSTGRIDSSIVDGADAVINLNGRGIGDGRWTPQFKQELISSRIHPTRTLAEAILKSDSPPAVLINASAVGFYGDRGDEELDEQSTAGEGFLAELSREWESAAETARSSDTRVVTLRLGMVVSRGGALAKMLTPFKLGFGGPFGSGRQWWPWVALEDVVGAVRFILGNTEISGPVNVVSPQLVRCCEFTKTLGGVLKRPAVLPVPGFAARLALGEMADALLLASARVRPAALEVAGFRFRVGDLETAIRTAVP